MSAQELVSLFSDPKIVGSDPGPLLADAELGPLKKKHFHFPASKRRLISNTR